MEQQVAQCWLRMDDFENRQAASLANNLEYDHEGLLLPGVRERSDTAAPPASRPPEWVCSHAGVPPTFVPHCDDVVNRGAPRPGSWVYL